MAWGVVKLGDYVDILSGYPFDSKLFNDSIGTPVIRIRDVIRGYTNTYYNGAVDKSFLINQEDILIGMDGEFNTARWSSEPALLNQRVCKISSKDPFKLSNDYLFYLLPKKLKEIEDRTPFVTVKHLSVNGIKNIEFQLPPLHIQQQIADTLDKADALRKKDLELLQKYDELAQAIFYEMFGDPVKNDMSWEVSTLGDACTLIKDGPHVSPKYFDSGIPFISVNNIINGTWDLSKVKYISENDFAVFSKRCKPEFGDILYTKGGTTGFAKFVDVNWKFMNWVHIAVLKFDKSKISGRFLEYMLNTNFCYQQSQKLTRGIANRDLVLGEMKKIKIFLPNIEVQKKFAKTIDTLVVEKKNCIKLNESSSRLFRSLLFMYFSKY